MVGHETHLQAVTPHAIFAIGQERHVACCHDRQAGRELLSAAADQIAFCSERPSARG